MSIPSRFLLLPLQVGEDGTTKQKCWDLEVLGEVSGDLRDEMEMKK